MQTVREMTIEYLRTRKQFGVVIGKDPSVALLGSGALIGWIGAWIAVGRSFERFALRATALKIRHAHVNMPIEVPAVRPAFADWLGIPGRRPDLVIRFGKAAPMPMSIRRPLDDVIEASVS